MGSLEYRIQLKDISLQKFGQSIISSGGLVLVCQNGSSQKQALVDSTGATKSNPFAPTRGFINFFVADTVTAGVDLYIQTPGGQFKVITGIQPSGPNEVGVDTSKVEQCVVLPFNIADVTPGTEYNSQFIMPAKSQFLDRLHGCGINVVTVESAGAKTISVGLLSSESGGTATGLINASSTATAGLVTGTNGALFSSNAPANSDTQTASHLSYTLSGSGVAAAGFVHLPYRNYGSQ